MKKSQETRRLAAVAPGSRGFGFAVVEGMALINWETIWAEEGNKNEEALKKLAPLFDEYKPKGLVMFDALAPGSRRAPRIRELTRRIIDSARERRISVKLFSRQQIGQAITGKPKATKYQVAEVLAETFSEPLAHRLPKKRRAWQSEDSRMDMFDAVALAIVGQVKRGKTPPKPSASTSKVSLPAAAFWQS
ncbi:MAG TPA: hypothetical protein VFE51_30635 [Verrucomicrobiae bacterium]|nr:hypothetical protein [Verrucomicrobiae bacterium]